MRSTAWDLMGLDSWHLVRVIAANVAVITLISLGIGASAPRWPREWLRSDAGPLRLTRWDYSLSGRTGIARLARRLPEAGAAFGGVSKRTHPRRTSADVLDYLLELRRAEWVHWLAMTAVLPMLTYNPWWMWLSFLLAVAIVNGSFIAILRRGRVRMYQRLATLTSTPEPADA